MNLRVLHITPALFGNDGFFGGAERYSYELARHMARVVPTRLVSFSESPRQFEIEQLQVKTLGPPWYVRGQRFNPIHPGLLREIAWADVIHCHQPRIVASELSAILSRISGRRVFACDLGGGGWCLHGRINMDPMFHGHLHISAYSQMLAKHHNRSGSHVIYGGVDTEQFSPDDRVNREPVVVFVGRLMPHKGVDDLIKALPPGLRLEVIGRPYHEQYYRDLQRLAEGKHVVFRHDALDIDIVNAYRRAICVVLPSVYRTCYGGTTNVPELLGQTLIEGMACETAAICTDVASMPEVVIHQQTGFVVPPNDPATLRTKLCYLRDNPQIASELGIQGRRHVLQKFTWEQVVSRCLAAYRGA